MLERPAAAVRPAGELCVEAITTYEGLAALSPHWDELLAESPRPSPFLWWDWIDCWWRVYGSQSRLCVLSAHTATGELAGIAPLYITRRRRGFARVRSLELLGSGGWAVVPDHLDFLTRAQDRDHIVSELIAAMLRQPGWDCLLWDGLEERSRVPAMLRARAPGLHVEQSAGHTCPYLRLPERAEDLWPPLKARHPQFVQNLRRYRRRLEARYRTRFLAVTEAGAVAPVLAALVGLHGKARARHGDVNNLALPASHAFHLQLMERLAPTGKLYLVYLECDERIVAVLYGYVLGGVLYFFQSGFDTGMRADGVGKLLLARVMEDAVERLGAGEFDFLRGAESYKRLWTDTERHIPAVRAWRAGLAPALDRMQWRLRRRLAALRDRLRRPRDE